ncbi:MAG TPA: hypothetical protein VEJ46_18160 [Candidatus Acidoferrum sp.]|nr:hypothetical protein [Candidatus Acidoferrum sp.]
MKGTKFLAVLLCLAALTIAPSSFATTPPRPQVVGVGSSALFPSIAVAAVNGDPIATSNSNPCGTNLWTNGGFDTTGGAPGVPVAAGVDNRTGVQASEPGNIWIVWNGNASPSLNDPTVTQVCVYLSVDSVVGQRLFLGQMNNGGSQTNGWIALDPNVTSVASVGDSQCKIAFLNDTGASCQASPVVKGNLLPQYIYNIVNGANFNVAFTDIRPEDGLYASNRALCSPGNQTSGLATCLGYNFNAIGTTFYTPIYSTFDANNVAFVVPYSIPASNPLVPGSASNGTALTQGSVNYTIGFDPINTSFAIPSINTIPIGADPVLVLVNWIGTSACSFNAFPATNVNPHVLSQLYAGFEAHTPGIVGAPCPGGVPVAVPVVQREPTSGTYNTFEWQTVRTRDSQYGNSQETGLPAPSTTNSDNGTTENCNITNAAGYAGAGTYANPETALAGGCADPLDVKNFGGYTNWRMRAIGTGDMVSAVNSTNATMADSIGYAFWSLASFGGKTNIHYLTVGGVDPLYSSYTAGNSGVFPTVGSGKQCSGFFNTSTFSCTGWNLPTFANIIAGNYRIWSVLRALVDQTAQSYTATSLTGTITPQSLIQEAQDQAYSTIPDFVPWQICVGTTCGSVKQNLPVFRSHYGQVGQYPDNGIGLGPAGLPEAGGDMTGDIFPIASEADYINFYGPTGEFYSIEQ